MERVHRDPIAYAERHPDDSEGGAAVGYLAVAARDPEAQDGAVERLESSSPADAAWLQALMANQLGDHAAALAAARPGSGPP